MLLIKDNEDKLLYFFYYINYLVSIYIFLLKILRIFYKEDRSWVFILIL